MRHRELVSAAAIVLAAPMTSAQTTEIIDITGAHSFTKALKTQLRSIKKSSNGEKKVKEITNIIKTMKKKKRHKKKPLRNKKDPSTKLTKFGICRKN